ncbi:hypothetical protein F4825DRAFT_420019 [Nemania diffusa]|nr:hypothetical protein F4825DRAFT_420019 [Nemania diffusa]
MINIMKITINGIVVIGALLSSTIASPTIHDRTTDVIKPTHPSFSETTDITIPQQATAGSNVLKNECDKERCQSCLKKCGTINHFTCFYFQCMNDACKGCQLWASR